MIDINLVPQHLRKNKKRQFLPSMAVLNLPKEAIIGLIGGLLALLFMIHMILYIAIFTKISQYKKEKREWEKILPAKNKVDAVISELRNLQNKINSIEKIKSDTRLVWSKKLNDISDNIPRGVWLNKISVNETVFLIDGSAVSKVRDEMTSVGNFVANLKRTSSFMNGLKNMELGSIQRRQFKLIDMVDFIITAKLQQ